MFPLLIRDKLRIPYIVCGLVYITLVSLLPPAELKHRQSGGNNRHQRGLFELLLSLFQYNSERTLAEYVMLCNAVFSRDVVRYSFLFLSCLGKLFYTIYMIVLLFCIMIYIIILVYLMCIILKYY